MQQLLLGSPVLVAFSGLSQNSDYDTDVCGACCDSAGNSYFSAFPFFLFLYSGNDHSEFPCLKSEDSSAPPRLSQYFLAGEGSDVFPRFILSLPCQRSPLFILGWLVGDSPLLAEILRGGKAVSWTRIFAPKFLTQNVSVYFFFSKWNICKHKLGK